MQINSCTIVVCPSNNSLFCISNDGYIVFSEFCLIMSGVES